MLTVMIRTSQANVILLSMLDVGVRNFASHLGMRIGEEVSGVDPWVFVGEGVEPRALTVAKRTRAHNTQGMHDVYHHKVMSNKHPAHLVPRDKKGHP